MDTSPTPRPDSHSSLMPYETPAITATIWAQYQGQASPAEMGLTQVQVGCSQKCPDGRSCSQYPKKQSLGDIFPNDLEK